MAETSQYRTVLTFLFVYVVLAWPPFLYLNREVLGEVVTTLSQMDPLVVVWVVGAAVILSGLFRADEGVERYNQFLAAPKNGVAVLVALSFCLAAASWWAVPHALFYFDARVTLNIVLLIILLCQVPMVVLLSLMTVLGKVMSPN